MLKIISRKYLDRKLLEVQCFSMKHSHQHVITLCSIAHDCVCMQVYVRCV